MKPPYSSTIGETCWTFLTLRWKQGVGGKRKRKTGAFPGEPEVDPADRKEDSILSCTETECLRLMVLLSFFCLFVCLFVCLFFVFLGPHLLHMEVPRLGVESELQLLAYTTVTAMRDLSCLCDPPHSSWQCQIFHPLRETRDLTCILLSISQVRDH